MIEINGIKVRGSISYDRSKKRHLCYRKSLLAQAMGGRSRVLRAVVSQAQQIPSNPRGLPS